MNRDTLRNAVLALFGILAVALVAATLPSAVQREPGSDGGTGPPGTGAGDGGPLPPPPAGSPGATFEVPFLSELVTLLAVVAIAAVLVYLFVHWRRVFRAAVVVLVVTAVVWLFLQLFSPSPSPAPAPSLDPLFGNGTAGGGDPEATDPSFAPVLAFVALALALLGAVGAVRRRSTDRDRSPTDESGTDDVSTAMGRAAGRAVDRIDGSDNVDNEVYRAWREMTALLDVRRPQATTPGEFESAAVDAGMDPADVHELTELFELVRYGGHELDSADERRAVELLERIESRYSEGEP